jgi:hypothetical protein
MSQIRLKVYSVELGKGNLHRISLVYLQGGTVPGTVLTKRQTCDIKKDGEAGGLHLCQILQPGAGLLGGQIQRELQHKHPAQVKKN